MVINYDKFEVFFKEEKIADVTLNPKGFGTLKVTQYTESTMRLFKRADHEITKEDFLSWLEWRTFPPTRFGANEILKLLGLNSYNRLAIIKKTHGVMQQDDIWIKFDGEDYSYEDALKWKGCN